QKVPSSSPTSTNSGEPTDRHTEGPRVAEPSLRPTGGARDCSHSHPFSPNSVSAPRFGSAHPRVRLKARPYTRGCARAGPPGPASGDPLVATWSRSPERRRRGAVCELHGSPPGKDSEMISRQVRFSMIGFTTVSEVGFSKGPSGYPRTTLPGSWRCEL